MKHPNIETTRREKWTVKHLDTGITEYFHTRESAKAYAMTQQGPVSLRRPEFMREGE